GGGFPRGVAEGGGQRVAGGCREHVQPVQYAQGARPHAEVAVVDQIPYEPDQAGVVAAPAGDQSRHRGQRIDPALAVGRAQQGRQQLDPGVDPVAEAVADGVDEPGRVWGVPAPGRPFGQTSDGTQQGPGGGPTSGRRRRRLTFPVQARQQLDADAYVDGGPG